MGKKYAACDDAKPMDEYLTWLANRVARVKECLKPTGAMWMMICDGLVSEVDIMCKTLGFVKRNHIIWYYTFGQHHTSNFTQSHTHLLYYTMSKRQHTCNMSAVAVPSARQVKYNDKRAKSKGKSPDNTWILFPEQLPQGFQPQEDTWLESRVCGTFKARRKHSPNQIPLPIMERIVLSTSNPGDLVIDPFCGTGTAGEACVIHKRSYVGMDVSKVCVEQSLERIRAAGAEPIT